MKKIQGFTLIELLIVIAVLGILITGLIVIINPMQQLGKARDTQRKSDLNQYRIALESYANDNNGKYPSTGSVGAPIKAGRLCTDGTKPLEKYIGTCPVDPQDTTHGYYYRNNSSAAIGNPGGIKYSLFVNAGLETISKTWVVCYNGNVGLVDNNWAAVDNFCPIN